MNNLYVLFILLFIFFMIVIGEIFKMKKEIVKLDKIISHLLKERKHK